MSGKLIPRSNSRQETASDFIALTVVSGDCWLWKGNRTFYIDRRQHCAARASWLLFRGELPPRMRVFRRCENESCVNPDHLRLVEDGAVLSIDEKLCEQCGLTKPADQFFFADRKRGRLFRMCKDCIAEYREGKKERLNLSRRKWAEKNPEKDRKAKRAHYEQNKKLYSDRAAKYGREHLDWRREQWRKRQMRKKQVGGYHTVEEWKEVIYKQSGCCYYCGEPRRLARDHVLPIVRGGSDNITNIVGACWSCNGKKGPKTLLEFIRWVLDNQGDCSDGLIEFSHREIGKLPLFA